MMNRRPSLVHSVYASLIALCGTSSGTHAQEEMRLKSFAESQSYTALGVRVDCGQDFNRDPGATQDCLTITGLRVDHREQFSKKVYAHLRLDPLGSPNKRYANSPFMADKPLIKDGPLLLVDSYRLVWTPRTNLEISLLSYEGAAKLPDASGLALFPHFADSGWDQTALAVTYNLTALGGVKVTFAGGNGEGELLANTDPQQYFGFALQANLIKGLRLSSGISLDGNQSGSKAHDWMQDYYKTHCDIIWAGQSTGFSTKRMAVALELDGKLDAARGLKAAVGWQQSTMSDLDRDKASVPSIAELGDCTRLRPDLLFIEDPTLQTANTMQHTVTSLSASYRILDTYEVGAYYEKHGLHSDIAFFQTCQHFGGLNCEEAGPAGQDLGLWSYGMGGGMDLSEGLRLSLEYHITSYAQSYKRFYFEGRHGKASQARDMVNARIAYNWDP